MAARRLRIVVGSAVAVLLHATLASAQDVPPEVEIEPSTAEESIVDTGGMDLRSIVTSVSKSTTTVEEAPAIVTVILADDIRQLGYRSVLEAVTDVPGFTPLSGAGETVWGIAARGQSQAALILHDGVSLFEAFANFQAVQRQIPVESIKRIEVVTGPGGVLWGANSLLGIVNIMTKDAEDVDGIEAGAGFGDGRGDRSDARAYVMVGQKLLGNRLSLFLHGSYDNYVGQQVEARQFLGRSPIPQPNGLALFGPYLSSDQGRSWVASFDGKITSGPLSLYWLYTDGDMLWPTGSNLGPVQQAVPPDNGFGPNAMTDPRGTARSHEANIFDRFAALEYADRFGDGLVNLNAKAFLTQAVIDLPHWLSSPASTIVPGGVSFTTNATSQRGGFTVDGGFLLPGSQHLLLGGELVHEWMDPAEVRFLSPDPSMLGTPPGTQNRFPFSCPLQAGTMQYVPQCPLPFAFGSSRDVAAAYAADQWRPHSRLLLDAGARVQVGFGQLAYDLRPLVSGTAVWNFAPAWHLKANFAQGFRPPVFNDVNSNSGGGIQIASNPNIKSESSSAVQGEINGRLRTRASLIEALDFRADYSYTVLDNLIVINSGRYENAGSRGISSAELLGRGQLRGGDDLQIGYTFLRVTDASKGYILATPAHWFTITARLSVIRNRLDAVSSLLVSSSAEDPNRVPITAPDNCLPGVPKATNTCGSDAPVSSLTFDRLPPLALWKLGLRWRVATEWDLDAFVYNVLDQQWYLPDYQYDLFPQGEIQPTPGMGRSVFATLRYRR